MIRVRRPSEPPALRDSRLTELPRVSGDLAAGVGLSEKLLGHTYRVARVPLCDAQHGKCAYCEKPLYEAPYNDVEHYRPKVRAIRRTGHPTTGYWWLTWTWENLLFACNLCDRSKKRDQFPLAPGSVVLPDGASPPGGERPLLLDPATDDPMEHIQFRRFGLGNKQVWRPVARGGSVRGDTTIRVAGLDRDDLIVAYTDHVRDFIASIVDELREVERNMLAFHRSWARRVLPATSARRPFAALAWDVIDDAYPAPRRRDLRVYLPRP